MNILFYSTNSPYSTEIQQLVKAKGITGGAEISLRLIAEGLADRGHNIFYMSRFRRSFLKEATIKGVYTIHFSTIWIPKLKSFNRFMSSKYVEKYMESYALEKNIDVFFTYATYPDTYHAVKIGRKLNIPVVQRIGGQYWRLLLKANPRYYNNIYYTFKNVSCVIYVSQYLHSVTEDLLKEYSLPLPTKHSVFDIGTDMKNFSSIYYKENEDEDEIKITFIGSFKEHSKRQDILIKALPEILKKYKNIKVLFVGRGPTLNECKILAENLGVIDYVNFLEHKPHFEVLKILKKTDIVVLSTVFEGAPKSIVEAMSAGKPVVASDIPPIKEVIKDGHTGLLAKNNPEDFSRKIIKLIEDENLRSIIGFKAREFAELRFDHKKNIESYETLLREIIDENRTV